MQYLGGKERIAKYIVPFLEANRQGRDYLEPFCGECSIVSRMSGIRIASDAHEDLMLLWQALQTGWVPPKEVSEEEYQLLKHAPPSALRGFVGFGCSFSGKWFGGYARFKNPAHHSPFALSAHNTLLKKISRMREITFLHASYEIYDGLSDYLIYCDPPYVNTTGYKGTTFDSANFWNWARLASINNLVYISEYSAPSDFKCCLEIIRDCGLNKAVNGKKATKVERLFTLNA